VIRFIYINRLTDKRYARDNRLIIFKSSYW